METRQRRHAEFVSASYQHCTPDRSRNKFGMTILCLAILFLQKYECVFASSAPLEKISDISSPIKNVTPSTTVATSPVTPQPVDFKLCCKQFKFDSQKLFYLTLASINANRFKVEEIQSQSGYVIFTAAQKQFLASIITIDSKTSMLKITPCSNVYFFPIGIVQNIFKYIELNLATPVEKLNVL